MIHALIDTAEHRKILGFETGTRAQFDRRRGGDPLWVFVDSYQVRYRANIKNFMRHPTRYMVDTRGDLFISTEPPITIVEEIPDVIPGYVALKGPDGRYLKGADGNFIYGYDDGYGPPPTGMTYLLDSDNAFLTDSDNALLIESLVDENLNATFVIDGDGNYITDGNYTFITE